MPYVDTLLTSDETILYRTKKHWIAPVLATATGVALTLGGLGLLLSLIWIADVRFLGAVVTWSGIGLLVVGVVFLATSFMHWWSQEYVVTNQKVIKAEGWLRKRSEGASLEKINEIEMEQSLIGRMMDFGTLKVRTASDEADLRYWMMRSPAEFRKQILEAKQILERSDAMYIADAVHTAASRGAEGAERDSEDAGAPNPGATPQIPPQPQTTAKPQEPLQEPTQPLATAQPQEPLQAPAQPQASNPASDPAQIPALIQQLAALRDSGAITAEEFDAKKADLLSRM